MRREYRCVYINMLKKFRKALFLRLTRIIGAKITISIDFLEFSSSKYTSKPSFTLLKNYQHRYSRFITLRLMSYD